MQKCKRIENKLHDTNLQIVSQIHIFITWINSNYNFIKILHISLYKCLHCFFFTFCLWTTEILIHLVFIHMRLLLLTANTPCLVFYCTTNLFYWFLETIYMSDKSNKLQVLFTDLMFAFYSYSYCLLKYVSFLFWSPTHQSFCLFLSLIRAILRKVKFPLILEMIFASRVFLFIFWGVWYLLWN